MKLALVSCALFLAASRAFAAAPQALIINGIVQGRYIVEVASSAALAAFGKRDVRVRYRTVLNILVAGH